MMRLSTLGSIAVIALSGVALAQSDDPAPPPPGNTVATEHVIAPDDASIPDHDVSASAAPNMLDESASPPPTEPK